jgi:hypothetical protein
MKSVMHLGVFVLIGMGCGCQKYEVNSAMLDKYNSMSPYCIGRNMISIPKEFTASHILLGTFSPIGLSNNTSAFEVKIETRKISVKDFSAHVLTRSGQLKDNESKKVDVLRAEDKISETATLFRIQSIEDAYRSELHFLLNNELVVVTTDSYKNTFLSAEKRLIAFMSDFIVSDPSNVNGFCLGTMTIRGNFSEERGNYSWRDNAGNAFNIKVDTFGLEDPTSLLQRTSGPGSLLSIFHIGHTVLRSGKRTTADMSVEEWLGWSDLEAADEGKAFKFVLETRRKTGGKATPSMTVTFDSALPLADGTYTKTNLSDSEAITIWDAVINSIQPAK